jgi:primosomal protein N' (replication factor Y)
MSRDLAPVAKKAFMEHSGASPAILGGMIRRGIFEEEKKTVSRIPQPETGLQPAAILTAEQQKACDEIRASFATGNITLLHGVASSGKTEIYIHLIADELAAGRQALYLLPEIAITTQITVRLQRIFGQRLLVCHSGISDGERIEIWHRLVQSDEPLVILGNRSAVFLPFGRPGLIIIDEEHDTSYKQQDASPRYHARNTAMILAAKTGAKTLLGSATPSLESYMWAKNGKYGMVQLSSRYGGCPVPRLEIADVRDLRRKRRMKDTLFSPILRESIDGALSAGEQVMLFQNRRGFAPLVECGECGHVPHCRNCDVSLTYHKQKQQLVCHYCGYSVSLYSKCTSCGSSDIKMQGFGTEKIEEEVATLFPSAKTARLDVDAVRSRKEYGRILVDFEEGKTQILVGAQMITKGLDFGNVSVVGIMNADGMMNMPDFRAYERAFQMMMQVSGRAGRRDRQGLVVLQTSQSDNPLLQLIRRFDYEGMAQVQLQERYAFHYPPYTRLLIIILRSPNEEALESISTAYSEKLRARLGEGVSAPVYPPVTRVKAMFVRKIMIKTDMSASVPETRRILDEVRSEMQRDRLFRQVTVRYDVDPQ